MAGWALDRVQNSCLPLDRDKKYTGKFAGHKAIIQMWPFSTPVHSFLSFLTRCSIQISTLSPSTDKHYRANVDIKSNPGANI